MVTDEEMMALVASKANATFEVESLNTQITGVVTGPGMSKMGAVPPFNSWAIDSSMLGSCELAASDLTLVRP